MKYHIVLITNEVCTKMPQDTDLGFFDACDRADIYKRSNPAAVFSVEDENGDIVYQV